MTKEQIEFCFETIEFNHNGSFASAVTGEEYLEEVQITFIMKSGAKFTETVISNQLALMMTNDGAESPITDEMAEFHHGDYNKGLRYGFIDYEEIAAVLVNTSPLNPFK